MLICRLASLNNAQYEQTYKFLSFKSQTFFNFRNSGKFTFFSRKCFTFFFPLFYNGPNALLCSSLYMLRRIFFVSHMCFTLTNNKHAPPSGLAYLLQRFCCVTSYPIYRGYKTVIPASCKSCDRRFMKPFISGSERFLMAGRLSASLRLVTLKIYSLRRGMMIKTEINRTHYITFLFMSTSPSGGTISRSTAAQVIVHAPGNSNPQFLQKLYQGAVEEEQEPGALIVKVGYILLQTFWCTKPSHSKLHNNTKQSLNY